MSDTRLPIFRSGAIHLIGGVGAPASEDDKQYFTATEALAAFDEAVAALPGQRFPVRIHSLGGSVTQSLMIYNKIRELGLDTYIDGVAASGGAIIAMAGKKVYMAENARMMIHNAWTMTAGNSQQLRQAADTLDTFDDDQVAVYKKKTGLREDNLRAMMAQEKWFLAPEARDLGFVDEVVGTVSAAAIRPKDNSLLAVFASYQFDKPKPQDPKMSTPTNNRSVKLMVALAAALSLSETANDDQIAEAATGLKSENEKLKARVAELEKAQEEAKKAETEAAEKEAVQAIEAAVAAKRIPETSKAGLLAQAKSNPAAVKEILAAVAPAAGSGFTSVADQLAAAKAASGGASAGAGKPEDDPANWDYKTWSKKDPKGLGQMKTAEPARFNKLVDAHKASVQGKGLV